MRQSSFHVLPPSVLPSQSQVNESFLMSWNTMRCTDSLPSLLTMSVTNIRLSPSTCAVKAKKPPWLSDHDCRHSPLAFCSTDSDRPLSGGDLPSGVSSK